MENEPKPVKLTPEQQVRRALDRYTQANDDENSKATIKAVPNMTASQAWQELRSIRSQGNNEAIYQQIVAEALRRRGG